ncbi:ComEC/Rec2 family competence protein [Paenibacillus sp. GXUN7292]|uniref:ComEC/Rec2 family competence protein n=1 Tax=Paenibacillus sp. GXUN7292 TaxID=3422499 RepID=UPI003D7E765D
MNWKWFRPILFMLSAIMLLSACGAKPIAVDGQAPGSSIPIHTEKPSDIAGQSAGPTDHNSAESSKNDPQNGGEAPAKPGEVTTSSGKNSGKLIVHFIDVGQGASQLLIGPTGKTMLIDAGNNDKEAYIVDYLKKQQIKKIDILIGTHPDADHIGGLDAVIHHFDIGKIYMPKVQANTKTFEDVLLAVKKKNLKVTTAKAGVVLDWEEKVEAEMIAPIEAYTDTNEMSAVLRLVYGDTSFLLTGDAESKSEADMLKTGASLQADVLLVSHHGSKTSTSEPFLKAVNPKYAVIQSGKDNKYGHPASNVLDRLKRHNVKVYRNDLQGHIIFTSDGKIISTASKPSTLPNATKLPPSAKPSAPSGQTAATPSPAPQKEKQITAKTKIDNAKPAQNSLVTVTVTVTDENGKPVKGAKAELTLGYKSTTSSYEGITDGKGHAEISFRIGRATKDFTVQGTIDVSYDNLKASAKTSFTPQ